MKVHSIHSDETHCQYPTMQPILFVLWKPSFKTKKEHKWWYGVKSDKDKQNQVGSFWYNLNLRMVCFLVRWGEEGSPKGTLKAPFGDLLVDSRAL